VIDSVMPEGVEHIQAAHNYAAAIDVIDSVMPEGVEHEIADAVHVPVSG